MIAENVKKKSENKLQVKCTKSKGYMGDEKTRSIEGVVSRENEEN